MYIVKRPFRNFGKVLTVGSVIAEPTAIKRFKGRLAEGKIIEVTEQTYDVAARYFKDKYGVVIPAISAAPTDTVETENAEVMVETERAEVKVETEKVKAAPAKVTPAKAKSAPAKATATIK